MGKKEYMRSQHGWVKWDSFNGYDNYCSLKPYIFLVVGK